MMNEEKTIISSYETIKKYCESHYPDCSECCFSQFCLMSGQGTMEEIWRADNE